MSALGTFNVSLQVGDLAGQRFADIEALADTGSTYTVLSAAVLVQLGVQQEGQCSFQLGR